MEDCPQAEAGGSARWLPPRLRGAELPREARAFLVAAGVNLAFSAGVALLHAAMASVGIAWGAALAAMGSVVSLGLFYAGAPVVWAANLLFAAGWTAVGLLGLTHGLSLLGFVLPITFWSLMARATVGPRWATGWACLWAGLAGGMLLVQMSRSTPFLGPPVSRLTAGEELFAVLALLLTLAFLYFAERARRRSMEQASEVEDRYRTLVRSAPLGLCRIDGEGRVRNANPALARLLGASAPSALEGMDAHELVGLGPALGTADGGRGLACGETRVREITWVSPWGRTVELRIHVAPHVDGQGEQVGHQLICEDVGEQRRALRALWEARQRLALVLESTDDVVSELLPSGEVVFVSANVERVSGWPRSKVIGRKFEEWVHPEDRAQVREVLHRLVRGRSASSGPFRFQCRDGQWIWLESSFRTRTAPDGSLHISSACRDVTRRVELEIRLRQSQKMEAVGLLAGGVAHDFNNLLTVVATCGEELLAFEDPEVRKLAADVSAAAERGASLTRRLLSFSRSSPQQMRVVELGEVVGGLCEMLERLMPETVRLGFRLARGLPAVCVDRGMVEDAVVNLVLNARDAMPRGGPIELRTMLVSGPSGAEVCLEVEDSGAGMMPEVQARAFEPFFSTKAHGEGTGLGLSMVESFAKQMGGRVEIESRPGNGTTVRMRFPAATQLSPHPRSASASEARACGGETILVAEDDAMVRSLIVQILQGAGYRVREASNGRDALARAEGVDLVLTDVVMPELSGPELVEQLRSRRPGLPSLFITGYPRGPSGLPHDLSGEEVLQKPFRSHELLVVFAACSTPRPRSPSASGGGASRAERSGTTRPRPARPRIPARCHTCGPRPRAGSRWSQGRGREATDPDRASGRYAREPWGWSRPGAASA